MKRDLEIERLIKYAQALGVEVIFSNMKNPPDDADWSLMNTKITIYIRRHPTKTDTILSLIHEISHSLDNIHRANREVDWKFEEALPNDNEDEISKKRRKIILDNEKEGTRYWEIIYKETNLSFPIYKLHAQMELDVWQYEVYYESGKFPKRKERDKKRKEIFARHKRVKYE